MSASASGQRLTIISNSINPTTYRATTSSTATEVVSLGLPPNGVQTAVIGGTKTTGDVLTITTFDPALAGGSKAVNYTVQAGDTLTTIATNMAAAINADTALQAIAVSATSSGTVLNIKSASANATTYTKSINVGATETIALAPSTSASQYGYNNLNEMTSSAAGGATKWQGTTNKALKAAAVNSNPAALNFTQGFTGNATLANGVNNLPAAVTDGSNTTKTNNYLVSSNGSASAVLIYDLNGNMISDGTNSYLWDAENKLCRIVYPGTGNFTDFYNDSFGQNIKIIENVSSMPVSSLSYVWANSDRREARNSSGSVLQKFYSLGEASTSTNYYYFRDLLGSIETMSNFSGVIQWQSLYEPFGREILSVNTLKPSFGYAQYFKHDRSGSNLTLNRQYLPSIARWTSRDPLLESVSTNLYAYVSNNPINKSDPLGLMAVMSRVGDTPHNPNNGRGPGRTREDCMRDCEVTRDGDYCICSQINDPVERENCYEIANQKFEGCKKSCLKLPPAPVPPVPGGPPPSAGSGGGGFPPPPPTKNNDNNGRR